MKKSFPACVALTALSLGSLFAEEGIVLESRDLPIEKQTVLSEVVASGTAKKKQEEAKPCPKKKEAPPVLLPSEPCPDSWRFSADFLYLLPTVDDTYFVLAGGSTIGAGIPNGTRENNDFGFTPAFRVGAEYALCDTHRNFQGFYSRLSSSENSTVAGSHLFGTVGCPDVLSSFENYTGSASSSLSLLYQRADANFSQQVVNSKELYLYIQPGIEYAYLRLNQSYGYQITGGTSGAVSQKSRTWGVGPQLGLGIDYSFYQGELTCSSTHAFSITALFSGSILTGSARAENFESLGTTTVIQVDDEHTWRVFPAAHARVGLNYLIRGDEAGGSIGIGYELNTYARAVQRVSFSDDVGDAAAVTNYYNFDVQGLYVSAAISF